MSDVFLSKLSDDLSNHISKENLEISGYIIKTIELIDKFKEKKLELNNDELKDLMNIYSTYKMSVINTESAKEIGKSLNSLYETIKNSKYGNELISNGADIKMNNQIRKGERQLNNSVLKVISSTYMLLGFKMNEEGIALIGKELNDSLIRNYKKEDELNLMYD